MKNAVAYEPSYLQVSTGSQAYGEDAKHWQNKVEKWGKEFSTKKISLISHLAEIYEDCIEPNWDGYEAERVVWDAYLNAKRFLETYPPSMPLPELSVDPDGEIVFEWYVSPYRNFSVSIGAEEVLNYAGLFDDGPKSGTDEFFGDIPAKIFCLINQLYP